MSSLPPFCVDTFVTKTNVFLTMMYQVLTRGVVVFLGAWFNLWNRTVQLFI